jgi:general secretion pathway protein E/type IV pilus assembly protein PilB
MKNTLSTAAEENFLSAARPAAAPAVPEAGAGISRAPETGDTVGESGFGKAAPVKPMRIGERLMSMGLISKDQLEIALREQAKSKKLLGNILVSMSFITESALGEVLAESTGAQKFDAREIMLDPKLLAKIPRDVCMRNKIIPISLENNTAKIAMVDVYNVLAIDQVRRHLDKNIKIIPLYTTEAEISEMIERYYDYEMSIDGILREIETGIREKGRLDGREEGYINPTVRLVSALLVDAIRLGASDIHFEPEGSFLRLRYRIDGTLQQIRSFHRDYWPAMLVRLKEMRQEEAGHKATDAAG